MTRKEFNEWYGKQRHFVGMGDRYLHDWICCEDGFFFSVQASEFHQCHPRNSLGPWTHFEVGYPSSKPQYIEMKDTVEGFVSLDQVLSEINFHGGIDFEAYETMDVGR